MHTAPDIERPVTNRKGPYQSRSGLTTLSRQSVGTYQKNKLTRNSSGNARQTLYQVKYPDPLLSLGLLSNQQRETQKQKATMSDSYFFSKSPFVFPLIKF